MTGRMRKYSLGDSWTVCLKYASNLSTWNIKQNFFASIMMWNYGGRDQELIFQKKKKKKKNGPWCTKFSIEPGTNFGWPGADKNNRCTEWIILTAVSVNFHIFECMNQWPVPEQKWPLVNWNCTETSGHIRVSVFRLIIFTFAKYKYGTLERPGQ